MDEAELSEVFRQAAHGGPAASFDEQDVRRGSRRVTARRRTALAGGTLVSAAVLAGGVGFGTGAFGPSGTVAQPPRQEQSAPMDQSPMALPDPQSPATPRSGPIVLGDPGGGAECGPPDQAVASALRSEFPEAAGTQPIGAKPPCPDGARTAAVTVRQGPANGKVAVLVTPPGSANAAEDRPKGTAITQLPTRSGGTVTVLSEPVGASQAPYADRISAIAEGLAPRF